MSDRTMTNEEALAILDTIPTIGEQIDALEMAIEALQERKTGKWIHDAFNGGYYCSVCGKGGWTHGVNPRQWKACPWCTTLMEVDE